MLSYLWIYVKYFFSSLLGIEYVQYSTREKWCQVKTHEVKRKGTFQLSWKLEFTGGVRGCTMFKFETKVEKKNITINNLSQFVWGQVKSSRFLTHMTKQASEKTLPNLACVML